MTNVLLVRTRIDNITEPYGAPPLGLLYLTSILRKNKNYNIKILDTQADLLTPEDVAKECRTFNPHVVGIGSMTLEAKNLRRVAAAIKAVSPNCPIIAGGPHASACENELLNDPNIDFGIIGEGERTFVELVDRIASGEKNFSSVKGIVFRSNGMVKKTLPREFIQDLDELDFPAWDAVDIRRYFTLPRFMRFDPHGAAPYMPIVTSRGCPYQCIYCHDVQGKLFRARSADNIMEEIKYLNRTYGICDFEMVDDIFNFNKPRVLRFCQLVEESGLKLRFMFPNGLRGDLLDREVLEALHKAGTRLICFAPETGSPRIHKLMKKNVKVEKLNQAIADAVDIGIHAHGFFMLGFPTETPEDIKHTMDYISKSKLTSADFFIVNLYPGTELYTWVKNLGKPVPDIFDDIDFHNTKFNSSEMSTEELLGYQRKLFFKFYLNPRRVWGLLNSPMIQKRHLLYYFWIFINRSIFRKRYNTKPQEKAAEEIKEQNMALLKTNF